MGIEVKKEGESPGGISFINQLIMTLQEAGVKLEEAFKKDNYEQVKVMKEFILKMQTKIGEELAK
jgi:hypothetical protein